MRTLLDVIGTWNASDALTLVVNYDVGQQQGTANTGYTLNNAASARWDRLAAYLDLQVR